MSLYQGENMIAGVPKVDQAIVEDSANPVSGGAVFDALGMADASSLLAMVSAANAVASSGVAPGGFGLGVVKSVANISSLADLKTKLTTLYNVPASSPSCRFTTP